MKDFIFCLKTKYIIRLNISFEWCSCSSKSLINHCKISYNTLPHPSLMLIKSSRAKLLRFKCRLFRRIGHLNLFKCNLAYRGTILWRYLGSGFVNLDDWHLSWNVRANRIKVQLPNPGQQHHWFITRRQMHCKPNEHHCLRVDWLSSAAEILIFGH